MRGLPKAPSARLGGGSEALPRAPARRIFAGRKGRRDESVRIRLLPVRAAARAQPRRGARRAGADAEAKADGAARLADAVARPAGDARSHLVLGACLFAQGFD